MPKGEKTTGHEKCRACEHYILQFSHILKGYVEGCDADICTFVNKKRRLKEKPKAFIKMKGETYGKH